MKWISLNDPILCEETITQNPSLPLLNASMALSSKLAMVLNDKAYDEDEAGGFYSRIS